MEVGGAFAAISAAVNPVDEDSKVATVPVEGSEDHEAEAIFSDEDAENLGKTNKTDENTDDDDDLPLSKVNKKHYPLNN